MLIAKDTPLKVDLQFTDGFSYSKGKMEEAFRAGGVLDKAPPKTIKDPAVAALKREDIDLIVRAPPNPNQY